MSFSKKIREIVHLKYDGHCAYCGKEITIREMEIDHIIPKYHIEEGYAKVDYDKDDIINLNPACKSCNRYKDTFTIEKFREQIQSIPEKLSKYRWIFRIALVYDMITIRDKKVTFYFERINNGI